MRNLLIIGNGFDIAHELDTKYSDFIADLKKQPQKYKSIDKTNHIVNSLINDKSELWSDIESSYYDILINFKNKSFLQKNYHGIEQYINIEEFHNDFEKVKESLHQYLLSEVNTNFKPLKNYENLFNQFDKKDTIVLNFNYTKTVTNYLTNTDIKLIHIHGELENDKNEIIFGFAASDEESKKLLTENNNNYVSNIKKFSYLYTNNYNDLKIHLDSTEYNIFILGHSCGISDSLILSDIFNSKNIHQIILFYYNDKKGYFNTMVNIDRIIDDYSKKNNEVKAFKKLLSYPNCYEMPQKKEDPELINYLKSILDKRLPREQAQYLHQLAMRDK